MKKILLFSLMATFAILAIGLLSGFDLSFIDITTVGTLATFATAPIVTIGNDMDTYLKAIKENDKLSAQEKEFATQLFAAIDVAMKAKDKSPEYLKQLTEMQNQLNELKELKGMKDTATGLQGQIDKLIADHEVLKAAGNKSEPEQSIIGQIASKAVELLKSKKEKKASEVTGNLELKTVVDMGLTTAITGQIPQAQREAGINYAPEQPLSLLTIVPTTTMTSSTMEWVDKVTEEGVPATRAEFETFPQRSWKSIVRSLGLKKIAVYSEYSREITEDVDYFESEVRRDLGYQMQRVLETEIYSGTGLTTHFKGILEYAQAWDNDGNTLETGSTPTIYDVIGWANTQIGKEHHNANSVMMNHVTMRKLKWTKDKNDNYIIPPFVSNGQTIEGMRVIVTNLVSDNELLVFDSSRMLLGFKRNIELRMFDQHAENATADILTMTATLRAAFRIKDFDTKAFVYCNDITAAVAALNPTS